MTRCTILILVVGLSASTSAWAQPDTSHDAEAKAYFEHGTADYKAGRYLEARAEFSAGYELSHRPMFLFNMAECSRLHGDLDIARDTYERYLREDASGPNAELARQRLVALGAKSTPEPAHDTTPVPPPDVVKPPPPPAPTPPPPSHHVPPPNNVPASTVVAPPTAASPPACAEGSSCWSASSGRTKRLIGLGVAGGGVALVATGIYFWRRAASLSSDVTRACEIGCDWNGVKDTYAASHSAATKQWVFLGLGGAAVVTGGVLYWMGSREHKPSSVVVAPTPDGAAVSWSGSW